ncbi:MAG TPA: reverse transcriptase domain-containing protein [Roseiflexaceae bacterium]|nr:reverse transcriptase domain-containing protein [Roseiflexaceae bacterium]
MSIFPPYVGPPLLEQICSVENLSQAWRRVRSNIQVARRGRSAGSDAVTLRDFEANWTFHMIQLADELRNGSYRPVPPRRVAIPKPNGGERAIAILAVRDRVAQRAVQQVLEPLFEPLFLDCSYGCRPRVGVPEAVARVVRYADQGLTWVVDADVASYFDHISHRILLGLVRQRVNDAALLRLIAQWLEVGALDTAEAAPVGSPSLLAHGQRLFQRVFARQTPHPAPPPPLGERFPSEGWDVPLPGMFPTAGGWPGVPGVEQQLWSALTVVKPVLGAVQMAWPYVQRIGGRRLAVAGAVAAGAVAVGEAVVRRQAWGQRGAMQGGALSPLLANLYLHPFDLALTSQGLRLVRFMDDFVILCASQAEAEQALELARRQLAVLELALHPDKTHLVRYADGLAFLGQALAPRARGTPLLEGVGSFEEAQRRLRAAAEQVRRSWKRPKGSSDS